MSRFRPSKKLTLAGVLLLAGHGFAFAQSLELQPIHLDVQLDNPSDSGELLLVAAYEPESTSPFLDRTLSGRAAVKSDAGRPSPSIIVGLIEAGKEEEFGIEALLPATVEANRFAYDDLDAREALRAADPELFRKLVEGGHIDPPEDALSRVLQTELKRFGCYTSGIDGIWGGGSKRAVRRYANALENPAAQIDEEPTARLFRSILLNGTVQCQQAAAAPSSSSSRKTTTRTNTPTRKKAAPARKQPVQKKSAPAKKSQSLRIVR